MPKPNATALLKRRPTQQLRKLFEQEEKLGKKASDKNVLFC